MAGTPERGVNAKGRQSPRTRRRFLGLPPGDSPQAAMVGDMITECVRAAHPTVAS